MCFDTWTPSSGNEIYKVVQAPTQTWYYIDKNVKII